MIKFVIFCFLGCVVLASALPFFEDDGQEGRYYFTPITGSRQKRDLLLGSGSASGGRNVQAGSESYSNPHGSQVGRNQLHSNGHGQLTHAKPGATGRNVASIRNL
ncbi:uncharacterized protein LOC132700996 [Cylas formicarius]|uniref:uncharacterized protein LOC132700996 n=1 Tax=Cylas formicarius TaxID=197179 RepID=UPI002958BC40|nr:uncharacterized protein LOC132700996 [Cylas formicarius]